MKIKLPKMFVKPKNLLSKHINSFITHAFSTARRSSSSSTTSRDRGGGKSKTRAITGDFFDDRHKPRMICHCHEPAPPPAPPPKTTADSYNSVLSFREFLDNNNKDIHNDDHGTTKIKINLKKRGSRRIPAGNNNDVLVANEGVMKQYSGRFGSRNGSGRRRKSMQNATIVIHKNGEDQEDEDEINGGGMELCKKRILMGEKCRPINVSGCLHYDATGILLPEDLFEEYVHVKP